MSETFYTSCADVLALCQTEKDNLRHSSTLKQVSPHACDSYVNSSAFLIRNTTPAIPRWLIFHRLSDLQEERNATQEEIEELRMECST